MFGEICSHPHRERIELYVLGILPAAETVALEKHLLICPACQDELAEADIFVSSMQWAAREFRAQEDFSSRTRTAC